MIRRLALSFGVAALLGLGMWLGWKWVFCHAWVPPGKSLLLNQKVGSARTKNDQYAASNEQGIQEHMKGPGRYLDINPWDYDLTWVNDTEVKARYDSQNKRPIVELRTVKNSVGINPPSGKVVVGPKEKGIQEALLTPGSWRINTFGQTPSDPFGATLILPGYVGVQNVKFGPKTGVLDEVLPPGLYFNNPAQMEIIPVEVGYMIWESVVELEKVDVTNKEGVRSRVEQPKEGTGVSFPLADGKPMYLDITVVCGVFPEDAPSLVRTYHTWEKMVEMVIEPQVLSICKNAGSNFTTQQFIEGKTRELFQEQVTTSLQEMGKQKNIQFLVALVRGFHPAQDIKEAIQGRRLAEEERKTLLIEQDRESVAAEKEQAKKAVEIAVSDFDAETAKLVENERELGLKKAAKIKADAQREAAALDRQMAEIQAQITKIMGKADADVIEAQRKAEAAPYEYQVKAYGSAEAYNLATFAQKLPADMAIEYRYAGPGTLWMDMKTDLQKVADKLVIQQATQPPPAAKTTTRPSR